MTCWVTLKGHCLGTYSLLRKKEMPGADSEQAQGPQFLPGSLPGTDSNLSQLEIWGVISQQWEGEARKSCFPEALVSLVANCNQADRSSK